MTGDTKRERPLYLDMDPDAALARFMQTDPAELKARLDAKKPPPKRGESVGRKVRPKPDPSG